MGTHAWLCPGRGSYAKAELGTLQRLVEEIGDEGRALVELLEAERADLLPSSPSLVELDDAKEFRASKHLPGAHASPLIYSCTILDARRAARGGEPVLVGGNSLGFYSALVVSGALEVREGMRLVCTMATLQEEGPDGGQVLWTLLDDDWALLPERQEQLTAVMQDIEESGHEIALSIRLGGHVVVAGDERAMRQLLAELPKVKLGKREFPFRLPFHGPFHTPRLATVAARARDALSDLPITTPQYPLIDGRGYVWSPRTAEPAALLEYTLTTQVTTTYDMTSAMRVALLEYAPSEFVLLEPGATLRAPLGHVERWLDRGALRAT